MACTTCLRIRQAVLSGVRIALGKSETPKPEPVPAARGETVIVPQASWPLKQTVK